MAKPVDKTSLEQFMRELGSARGEGSVYITGGGSAVLRGWRSSTIDVDLRLDPEPEGAFAAIPDIKRKLQLNVELASPQDFLPAVPGWRERSQHIAREGDIDFFHYDFVSQALTKIERGHEKDLRDVRSMVDDGLVNERAVRDAYDAIQDDMIRYPSIDPEAVRTKIDSFFADDDD